MENPRCSCKLTPSPGQGMPRYQQPAAKAEPFVGNLLVKFKIHPTATQAARQSFGHGPSRLPQLNAYANVQVKLAGSPCSNCGL